MTMTEKEGGGFARVEESEKHPGSFYVTLNGEKESCLMDLAMAERRVATFNTALHSWLASEGWVGPEAMKENIKEFENENNYLDGLADSWVKAAHRVGEDLASVGPVGYYEMPSDEWCAWALKQIEALRSSAEEMAGQLRRTLRALIGGHDEHCAATHPNMALPCNCIAKRLEELLSTHDNLAGRKA